MDGFDEFQATSTVAQIDLKTAFLSENALRPH